MRFLSHTHINGNGRQYRDEYACILARAAKTRKYTHVAVGCHGDYIASSDTLNCVWNFGIVPVRFAELDVRVDVNGKTHKAHISALNIPNHPIEGYKHNPKDPVHIKEVVRYLRSVGARIILNHPKSLDAIACFIPYIDGYEIKNGAHVIDFKGENPCQYWPSLIQFTGADYHVWKGKGNLDYFTELPDEWLGRKVYK